MRFSSSTFLAIAALPIVSAFDLHISTSKDTTSITPNVANELTPNADKSIYAAPKVNPPGACTNPAVRKEWRTLSRAEKKEWIDAIKARFSS
jgi:hypothetical protein